MAGRAANQSHDNEIAEIQELYDLFLIEKAPALIGRGRKAVPIPKSIYKILRQALRYMKQGKGVSVVPISQELTTQQAASLMCVSRPFLIEMLNRKELPFHKTGTHRRIYRKDVLDYLAKRDEQRKRILDEIARRAVAEGDYDQMRVPD